MTYAGKLLVARPGLTHPLFMESVIFVCQDSAAGTTGLILNKPLVEYSVADICESRDISYLDNEPLFTGGPVKPQSVTMLHTNGWWSENTIDVGEDLCLSSDEFMLEKLASGNSPDEWRLFAGVCMWSPGQLAAEIKGTAPYSPKGSWVLVQPEIEHVFQPDFESHWERAVALYSSQMVQTYF